ncbi:MAG: ribose 5-phosphate isomerase B [Bacillota bacterium]
MKVVIGCDHGGIVLKPAVIKAIESIGGTYIDVGTYTTDSCDYPDYAVKVAKAIIAGEAEKGILMCGTGIGISIAANKVDGIRCAHVTDIFSAEMCAEHNNANIMALGGRISDEESVYNMVVKYLTTAFAGGRHQQRLDKITAIEQEGI